MITPHGLGWLVRIEGNMHKELYRGVLQDDFLSTMNDLELDVHNYYFQQDNNPKHNKRSPALRAGSHLLDVTKIRMLI
jgi:hypothetical protein